LRLKKLSVSYKRLKLWLRKRGSRLRRLSDLQKKLLKKSHHS
jgi:hypothetical protein